MLPYPLTIFEIQRYYQKDPKSNGVILRTNLLKIKDGAHAINLDKYESIVIALELNIFQKKFKKPWKAKV